jgi:hypothetical protein
LPVGPENTSEMWHGGGRQAYNTFAAVCWSGEKEGSFRFVFVTRVSEKPSLLTCAIMNDLHTHWDRLGLLHGIQTICWWADSGTHFRSRVVLASAAYVWPRRWKKNYSVCFGVEAHFKNPCDPYFAVLKGRREEVAKNRTVSTLAEVVECFKEGAQRSHLGWHEEFFEWTPPKKEDVEAASIHPPSLPVGIKSSWCYTFTRNDERRESLLGRGYQRDVVTGVTARALVLPGTRGADHRTFFRSLDQSNIMAEGSEELERGGEAIHCSQRIHNGWKIYFRVTEPERFANLEEATVMKLKKRENAIAEFMMRKAAYTPSSLDFQYADESKARKDSLTKRKVEADRARMGK